MPTPPQFSDAELLHIREALRRVDPTGMMALTAAIILKIEEYARQVRDEQLAAAADP